ncbi:hypothetical protein D3C73_828810 [compost metagenome]
MPGQLAAFAGLGALGNLDLQHFGVDQVFGGDAEAARGHLLDLAALVGAIARRVFATFAGIAAAAEAVHRNRQRLMCLGRERTEADRCGIEAREQLAGRCDVVQGCRRRRRHQLQQIAQRRGRACMHGIAVLLPRTRVTAARRALQGGHHVRVVHVVFAAVHILQQAADIHALLRIPGLRAQFACIGIQACETGATDARGGIGEAQVDDLRLQADDLEQLRAAIAGHGADAHLRDDLRQALVDALAVAAADLRLLTALAELEDAATAEVEQGLVGQVRIDGRGTEAEQAGHVVRVARGAGLDDQVDVAAQAQL